MKLVVLSITGSESLAKSVSKELSVPLISRTSDYFADGEVHFSIDCGSDNNVRSAHVLIIACIRSGRHHNDDIMMTMAALDACKRSGAGQITLVFPLFPYSRSDKKDKPRAPIMSAVIADMINKYVDNVISFDLHSGQTQGLITKPFHNLYFRSAFLEHLKTIKKPIILASPDAGGLSRVEAYCRELNTGCVVFSKTRDHTKANTILRSSIRSHSANISSIRGATIVIIDDIADTMGTMLQATNELYRHGAAEIIVVVTHGVLSNVTAYNKINDQSITRVLVSDTLPITDHDKIQVISCAPLLAKAVRAICTGGSVSELF